MAALRRFGGLMAERHDASMAIEITGMRFSWSGSRDPVLSIAQLTIQTGERVFIEGPSGSGKSTLLSLIAGVITPQQGHIRVNGYHLDGLKGAARDRIRADHIGYIYQMFNLIPYLSVLENVTLPCRFSSRRRNRALRRSGGVTAEAMRLLHDLGMGDASVIEKPVTDLSVGQQQRVAAARALIGTPEIIIADEPTSSLDADRREAFIQLLFNECGKEGTTVVFVSHDTAFENLFGRTIRLADINGRRDLPNSEATLEK
jgi:putative ABC transport system ATP-binding protein